MAKNEIPGYPNVTSIRLPDGFKHALDLFLNTFQTQTGAYISRSEFMVTATYWYLDHLINSQADTVDEIMRSLESFSQKNRKATPHPGGDPFPESSPEEMPESF